MLSLVRRFSRSLLVVSVLLLLPSAAYAQAAITGVVKDASGAVLPGVTVEAASPALIEKTRSVITDASGQYRIVDLRTGTYSVTMSLTGFTSVKREGIELSGDFVATVNGDLRVGALAETITVTGETPIVDVQSTRQQSIISKDVLATIPSSRNVVGIQAMIPGMSTDGDSGGIFGTMQGGASAIHGGRANDSRIYADGINMGWAGTGGGGGSMPQVAASQEVVMTISGGLAEAETSGVVFNAIPRQGANNFNGQFNYSGSSGKLQSSNYTQALKDAGLRAPFELLNVYDVSAMGGGRIIRDKLWFYNVFRQVGGERTVPGMFYNKNAGNPNSWVVDLDKSKQAFTNSLERQATVRLTWQATPRNKFNFHWSEQFNDANYGPGGGTATTTPEAANRVLYIPSRQPHASWQSPISGKLLAEAGWGAYQARYRFHLRNDGTHNPAMIQRLEQVGEPGCAARGDCIAGLLSRMPRAPGQGGFTQSLIGTLASTHASLSYVTGANSMKFGYQGGFSNPSQTYKNFTQVVQVRTSSGIPNQLTQTISVGPIDTTYIRNLIPINFFAQDQWTHNRLTLQGGVRYDSLSSNYPDQGIGGPAFPYAPVEILYPSGSTPGYDWKDITPRVGVAYDLFGNGKTAIRFNVGKYLEAISASNNDIDMNPLIRTAVNTTRTWTDSNRDFVPNCNLNDPAANGECARMDNQSLGQKAFFRTFDPAFVGGWGTRPNNWSLGVALQQEIAPRVSLTVSYNRNWWGNWYVVDNRATGFADYTPFSIKAPSDPRLPGNGGQTIGGLYNLVPAKVGQVDELAQASSNFGEQTENWQGIDISVVARLRGLTLQSGTSTGRRVADGCGVRDKLPELGSGPTGVTNSSVTANVNALGGGPYALSVNNPYCRIEEPYRTDFRGLASYLIPKADVQLSATWASIPGDSLRADYTLTAADQAAATAQIGRPLTGALNTVNLVAPATLWGARRNNVDLRIAKVVKFRTTRTLVGVDIFNLMNADTVTMYNFGFSPANTSWLTPLAITPARYARISVQVDF
jgi:hypothetical protein